MSPRLVALLLAAVLSAPVLAQAPAAVALANPAAQGPAWSELPPAQQAALAPLQAHWAGLDADRKRKWIAVAERFPGLPPQEQQRLQARMTQWAAMSPAERGRARQRYQELRRLPAAERQALWDAYNALPPEERQALARRSAASAATGPTAPRERRAPVEAPAAASTLAPGSAQPVPGRTPSRAFGAAAQDDARKRPVPVNPLPPASRPVTPAVVQVGPGATTTLVNKAPSPPLHNQPGLPKITATPGFVDPGTLLPSRGPQAAATIRVSPEPPAARTPIAAPVHPAAPGAAARAAAEAVPSRRPAVPATPASPKATRAPAAASGGS